ncbi:MULTISPECIES: heavy metal sensor histidine kinase [unclassified Polaromonas]|uniref:heavy metal sensor histidine kinase n=1 Tax=unclassified Polaromonas TaxID=2638319 RepID=UPI001A2D269A|nr:MULTISPECIES: heavy metal sensor histidine kinase [unclassified Polaromonas]MBG6073804.1 two-component system heavy metal sensor histidine kinase CusS [Polaromonas sp. CG_9.7]MBG6115894.1 two-component system heavy metal sensor histidine kinase CusS [Polaromonas sp. CG_9.2]MDH6185952.1 two-component system heavy metal sensor histidine kinase CusS [Polaromonas sp. CG_23.6]
MVWWSRNSLAMWIAMASALFGLILTGGAIVTGFYALSQQLDARAAQEIKGKRDLLLHVLSEMPSPEAIAQNQHRFGDLLIGHDDLHLALSDPTTGQPVMNFSSTAQQSVVALDVKAPTDSLICSWSSASGAQFIAARGTGWVANGKAVRYYLSLDRLHDRKLLSGFIRTTLIALPVLLLLVGLGAWLIARTSLSPLRRFHRLAASVGTQSLSQRVSSSGLPTELYELAQAFNSMLGRIDDGYQRLQAFSGELAHEMRTPVATLMGRTQVGLSKTRTEAELREVLEGNVEELERLTRLIADMLFIASAEHNGDILNREPVDLAREARQVVEYLSLLAEERGLTLEVSGAATIVGDRWLIQRALSNLVSNAIRHAQDNSQVDLLIAIDNDRVSVSVVNAGDGIAPDHLPHIFERFYRVDSARARLDGGTGLGLAIVRSIMSAHGGQVSAQSGLDGKTTFTLSFPQKIVVQ